MPHQNHLDYAHLSKPTKCENIMKELRRKLLMHEMKQKGDSMKVRIEL